MVSEETSYWFWKIGFKPVIGFTDLHQNSFLI